HRAAICRSWPDLRFSGRSMYVGEDFVVQEWTATATHPGGKQVSWEGLDVFPFEDGLIKRKDVYSNAHRRVPEQLGERTSTSCRRTFPSQLTTAPAPTYRGATCRLPSHYP